jgi:NAD(P)-dependent dehydrogenase (short-subunit alcohol dehydrogenase family)
VRHAYRTAARPGLSRTEERPATHGHHPPDNRSSTPASPANRATLALTTGNASGRGPYGDHAGTVPQRAALADQIAQRTDAVRVVVSNAGAYPRIPWPDTRPEVFSHQLALIAAAVAFLTSAEAGFITGQTLTVDGGWCLT